jgi:pimeloyl-ACP methyl ester carboxylesterase
MMATFALIHGAGDGGWYWHLVESALRARGHETSAPDLPEGEEAGLGDYADAVLESIGDRTELVVVSQSFGAFTAPIVGDRAGAELLVLVAPMIPTPGEPPDDWWSNTGYASPPGASDDDLVTYYHDVPPALAAEAMRRARAHPSSRAGREPWPLPAWPDVPTRVLLCREDRLFGPEFVRRVADERLGIVADEIDAGHCVALARPVELADRLEAFLEGSRPSASTS